MFRKWVKGTVGDRTCHFFNNKVTLTIPLIIFMSMYFTMKITPTVPLTIYTSMYFTMKLRLHTVPLTIFTSMYFTMLKLRNPSTFVPGRPLANSLLYFGNLLGVYGMSGLYGPAYINELLGLYSPISFYLQHISRLLSFQGWGRGGEG